MSFEQIFGLAFLLLISLFTVTHVSDAEARAPGALRPARLRCDYASEPLGIDAPHPRLSWILEGTRPTRRGQRQTAYQVQAASTEEQLRNGKADLWDTGKVASAESLEIVYAGRPLSAGQRAWWRVRTWNERGDASDYSAPAWWEMALQPRDWRAQWIRRDEPAITDEREWYRDRPMPLLRKEIAVTKPVARARAYVTGLGYYELRLNGEKVGNHVLDPGWTTYSRRVYYSTYDVTSQLQEGRNALGIMLGSGWYDPLPLPMFRRFNLRQELPTGQPRAILQLEITYVDGTHETVVTNGSWKTAHGPIIKNSVYLGEEYDARREQPGWDRPGFDDSTWVSATAAVEPLGPLQAQPIPPIRITRALRPVKVTEPKPGVFIVDMGQNYAGWVRLKVHGPAGTRVRMRYGELLYPDGTLNPMTSVYGQLKGVVANRAIGAPETAWQEDAYTLKGGREETYTPRFTFHGFRYVELTGFPGRPTLDTLEGLRLNSDVETAGHFECSNGMFNRLQDVVLWTYLSNLFSVESDCPHREKLGYGGDIVAASETAMLNLDMARFYQKSVHDFADAVRPNGGFTETAPYVGIADAGLGEGSGPVGWGTVHPLLLWQLYQYYGNRRLIEEQYPLAQRWVELLRQHAPDGILVNGIGDHETLAPKSIGVSGTGFYYYNVRLLEQLAGIMGRTEDEKRYAALGATIRTAFNRQFLKADGRVDTGTQANQAFALRLGLAEKTEPALEVLVNDILHEHGGHLTTGIFGTKYLLEALTDAGRADVAYTLANQRDFPGWGHMLEGGATTLWEHWEFSDNTFSHNHPMFGSVSEWFYKALAGINPGPDAVGFNRIVIRPNPVGDLTWAKGRYRSVRGDIVSEWKRDGGTFTLNVEIPPNTTAAIHVPAADPEAVTEGGKPASGVEGLRFVGMQGGAAVYEAGSGRYEFVARP